MKVFTPSLFPVCIYTGEAVSTGEVSAFPQMFHYRKKKKNQHFLLDRDCCLDGVMGGEDEGMITIRLIISTV